MLTQGSHLNLQRGKNIICWLVTSQVDHGENGVQVQLEELADLLHELRVVLGVDGDVVAGVVADARARDVHLDVHAAAVRGVRVQVPVNLKLENI